MERDEHFRCEWSQSICFCLLFVMDRFVSSDYWFSYFRRRRWSRPLGQFPSSFASHAFHFSLQSTIRSLVSSNSSSQPVQKRSPWKRKQGKAWQKRGSWGGGGVGGGLLHCPQFSRRGILLMPGVSRDSLEVELSSTFPSGRIRRCLYRPHVRKAHTCSGNDRMKKVAGAFRSFFIFEISGHLNCF